jgi:lipopolysaccharide/colanic/teichoic acid biosynthesis glycosyltransferase
MTTRLDAKRAFDVVASLAIGVVAAPVVALATLAIRATLGAPVLYRQQRVGRGGVVFDILKLRTMRLGTGDDGARLTPLGRILRAWSIDELPQLWNVLRGDMSLVGPRPLLPEYLGRYSPEQARRHAVRPGLTGLAQVEGRNALGWNERFALDVRYVDERTLGLDLRILVRTLGCWLRRDGISAAGHATMPPFQGTGTEGGKGSCAIS